MPATQNSAPDSNDLHAQIKTIRDEIAQLAKLLKSVAEDKAAGVNKILHEEADDLVRRSKHAKEEAAETSKDAAKSVEDYIVAKPIQSAVIALLIGILVGSFSRR